MRLGAPAKNREVKQGQRPLVLATVSATALGVCVAVPYFFEANATRRHVSTGTASLVLLISGLTGFLLLAGASCRLLRNQRANRMAVGPGVRVSRRNGLGVAGAAVLGSTIILAVPGPAPFGVIGLLFGGIGAMAVIAFVRAIAFCIRRG